MPLTYKIVASPDLQLLQELERLRPRDPFSTPQFAKGSQGGGSTPILIGLFDDGRLVHGCLAFMKKGRLTNWLECQSLPPLPADSVFWAGLKKSLSQLRVSEAELRMIGGHTIPHLGTEIGRRSGTEYIWELGSAAPSPKASNHKRNLSKAQKAGIKLEWSSAAVAVDEHLALIGNSMTRRAARGENVPSRINRRYYESMLQAKAGVFARAVHQGKTLSSIFLLQSQSSSYYQSAGTSAEGMEHGSSVFLIYQTAQELARQGQECFDLGGTFAEDSPGLARFKSGFGGTETAFEEVHLDLTSPAMRKLQTLLRLLKHDRKTLFKSFFSRDSFIVYCTTAPLKQPPQTGSLLLRKLTDEELQAHCAKGSEFHRQSERLDELGYNDAYGVFDGAELVHVSWLVSADHDAISPEREIQLRPGEMEITHCYTGSHHRGRGIYSFAISGLVETAFALGAHRVFMTTHETNLASQRGITKAGMQMAGRITRAWCPLLSSDHMIRSRSFRKSPACG